MADEEQEWRMSQQGNEDQGEDACMEADEAGGKNGTVDEGDGDEGETDPDDDDNAPGCYVLDIGIQDLEHSKIWVRAEYKRVYDYLENYYNQCAKDASQAPGAVLTGQPGHR